MSETTEARRLCHKSCDNPACAESCLAFDVQEGKRSIKTTPDLGSFQEHMDRCMKAVLAPMRRPDIKVTIIVRAPEALPGEAMISTNDDLAVVREAVSHFASMLECRKS